MTEDLLSTFKGGEDRAEEEEGAIPGLEDEKTSDNNQLVTQATVVATSSHATPGDSFSLK